MDPGGGEPSRGRARGRARASPAPEDVQRGEGHDQAQQQAEEVYADMYRDPAARRSSDESNGSGGNGNGNGNGSNGNGSSNGNGNGNGSDSRGGTPRGRMTTATPGASEEEARARLREMHLLEDYVVTLPQGFVKKGTIQHRDPKLHSPLIVSNYYGFRTHPEFQMRMHSVRVEPPTDDLRAVRRLISNNRENLPSYLCSGFFVYTTRPIEENARVFFSTLRNQPDINYTITLEYVRNIENTESTIFQFYNVVVRQLQYMMNFQLLGRHFFNPEGKVNFPNWRLELWPGFQNSIRQQEAGMMLNVESVWKVLSTNNVLNIMSGLRSGNQQDPQRAINDAVVGMMVITKYGRTKRAYKIDRVDFNTTPGSTFEYKGEQITYIEYYRQKYGEAGTIRSERQPMLVSVPKLRDQRRGQVGDIYLVPELCFPCGLNEELRSNFRLMRDLATCLHMPPNERVAQMQRFISDVNQNAEILETMRKWGIRVNANPVEFPGRFLNSENIIMGNDQRVQPDDKADWTNSFRSQRMLRSARLSNWAIIATNRDSQGIGNLVGTMQRVAGPLGYQIPQPQTFRASDPRGLARTIQEAMDQNGGKLDLVFVILPNNNADIYASVKKCCSIDYGVPSQCFLSKNLQNKGLMSICTKMVIQMNAKQGGEPWGVVNPLQSTMVLGYDVHHAGPGGGQSIGAMCAAISQSLGRYFSCVSRIPAEREEVATCVANMFEKCLKAFKEKNGSLPARIFMYRDGVGEGQLRQVFEMETQAFKDRIKAEYQGLEHPKLTFIIVNKRINTRFFHKLPNGQFQNPRPGLIVDDQVTRPERYDFFLISQTARQGCVGPTYYNVLLDENLLPPDRLQMWTFKMCHLYYNWSGTVAVPGPCQNAHKLALQVGTALKRPAHPNLNFLLHFL